MSIDFSKITGLTDRIGKVVTITDKSGKVLWSTKKPHEHIYKDTVTPPTCTEYGYTTHTCTVCGHSYTDMETDPNGHFWGVDGGWVTVTPATCESKGTEKHTCNTCGCVEERDVPALGHDWGSPYYSSEFSSGYGRKCQRRGCGETDELPYVECKHPESAYSETVITKPTCTEKGSKTCTCDVCRQSWSVEIPALGHTWGSPYYSSEFSSGYGQKCLVCDELEELAYVECKHPASAYHESVITNPTCTGLGSKICTCDVCHSSWSVSLPALGHSYTGEVIEPTCTEKGFTKYTCSRCGHSYTSDEKDPNGHNFAGGWVVTKAATCTGAGTERRTCLTCGHYEERAIPANDHSYTSKVTAPTCTTKGYTTHTCTVCGYSYTDSETAALGHKRSSPVCVRPATCTVAPEYVIYCARCGVEVDRYEDDGGLLDHVADGGSVTTQPTCTTTGIRKYYCQGCGTWLRDEVIPATGIHTYNNVVTAPTCTAGGYTTHTCTVCGYSYKDAETDPNGHFWGVDGGWVTVTPATCESKGTEKHTCNTCGLVETRDIPATGHSYTSKVTAPTCTAKGYTTHTCSKCNHSYTDNETAALGHNGGTPVRVREATCTVPAQYAVSCTRCNAEIDRYENDDEFAEHTPNEGFVTTNPTCVATGIRKYYCSKCGTWIKDEIVAATGTHTYSSKVTAPTCTEGGYTTHTCTVCGHSYTDNETDPNGHFWGVGGGWVTVTPATCVDKGKEKHTCNTCGLVDTRDIPAAGHNYEYDHTEDATCESGGYDVYTCTRCGDWYTTNETEENGHDFSDGWVTEKEATCEKTGTERRTCKTCGYWEDRDIPLADHDYEAIEDSSQSSGYIGVCRVCGDVREDHTP